MRRFPGFLLIFESFYLFVPIKLFFFFIKKRVFLSFLEQNILKHMYLIENILNRSKSQKYLVETYKTIC